MKLVLILPEGVKISSMHGHNFYLILYSDTTNSAMSSVSSDLSSSEDDRYLFSKFCLQCCDSVFIVVTCVTMSYKG
jgi:hypothetical protein